MTEIFPECDRVVGIAAHERGQVERGDEMIGSGYSCENWREFKRAGV